MTPSAMKAPAHITKHRVEETPTHAILTRQRKTRSHTAAEECNHFLAAPRALSLPPAPAAPFFSFFFFCSGLSVA